MKSLPCSLGHFLTASPNSWCGAVVPLIFGGFFLLLAGCSTIVNQSVPFNETDFVSNQTPATATVYGHAFVRSDTGVKHGAAGIRINLVPLNSYTEERAKIMESGKEPAPADSRLEKYKRTTVGDWGGGYKFENVPAGNYLLYCKVEWQPQWNGSMRRGASGDIYALARVQVSTGEHKSVVVTNLDPN